MTTTGWKLDHADEVDPFCNIPGADDSDTTPPTPAESAAAIRRRIRAADFAERCARDGREHDPRDDEPTDYER